MRKTITPMTIPAIAPVPIDELDDDEDPEEPKPVDDDETVEIGIIEGGVIGKSVHFRLAFVMEVSLTDGSLTE